jgi:hypothetical protein
MLDGPSDHVASKSRISGRDIAAAWLAVLLLGSTLMVVVR